MDTENKTVIIQPLKLIYNIHPGLQNSQQKHYTTMRRLDEDLLEPLQLDGPALPGKGEYDDLPQTPGNLSVDSRGSLLSVSERRPEPEREFCWGLCCVKGCVLGALGLIYFLLVIPTGE